MDIFFISAKDCEKCAKVKDWLHTISSYEDIQIHEIDSESEEAICVAIEKGIDDIPGVAIGRYSVCGETVSYVDIEEIIREALSETGS